MSNPHDPQGNQPDSADSGQQPAPGYPGQQPGPGYSGQQPDPYANPYANPYEHSGQQYQYSPYGQQQYTGPQYVQPGQQGDGAQYSQQYAHAGPQYGQPQYGQPQYGYGGQPPQGPGPKKNRTGLFVGIAIAVLVVIAVVVAAVVLVVRSTGDDASPDVAAPSSAVAGGGCGIPGTGEASPITERVASGPLSFPVAAAPGWTKESYTVYAQSIAAAGLEKAVGDGQPWQAGAEVGQTNFGSKLDTKEASSRMIQCIADGAGYQSATDRRVEQSQPEAIKVDGVSASKVTGKVLVKAPGVTVPGDDLVVIVVDSAPQTYLLLVLPIGHDDMARVGQAIVDQLKVARDV